MWGWALGIEGWGVEDRSQELELADWDRDRPPFSELGNGTHLGFGPGVQRPGRWGRWMPATIQRVM